MKVASGVSKQFVVDINFFHSVTSVEKVKVEVDNGSLVKSRPKVKVLVATGIMALVLSTENFIPTPQFNTIVLL